MVMAGDDIWANPYDTRGESSVERGEPSRQELLRHLQKKRERAEERLYIIDEEIRCVQDVPQERGAFQGCYETAKQQRQRLKQKYPELTPYPKRQRQRAGSMPNFGNMGMGRMPMPW